MSIVDLFGQDGKGEIVVSVPNTQIKKVVLAAGSAYSEPFSMGTAMGIGFILEGEAWTSADIALQVSADYVNWTTLADDAGAVMRVTNLPISARFARPFPKADLLFMFPYARIMSINTANTNAVNQDAARVINVCMK